MKKTSLIVAAGVAALAIPALAQMHGGHHGMGMNANQTVARTTVEARVKEQFAKVDTNKDGYVTRAEGEAAMKAHRADMMEGRFKAMDTDANGSISKAEFDAAHAGSPEGGPQRRAMMQHDGAHRGMKAPGGMGERMFDRADADKDGRVSLKEALARPLERFDAADTNKDGTLSAEERQARREDRREARQERREKRD
jgi:Ca2+-binding EF-hand superfamily protein